MLCIIIILMCLIMIYKNNPENFKGNEVSVVPINVVSGNDKSKINNYLNQIIKSINQQYKKALNVVSIDRIQKNKNNEHTNYVISCFVINNLSNYNIPGKKILIDFNVDNVNDTIMVNSLNLINSPFAMNSQRGGISARDTANIKQPIDIEKVNPNYDPILEYSKVQFSETPNKMVDRNSWILDNDRIMIGNIDTFPSKIVTNEWDKNGVEYTTLGNKYLNGLNHSTTKTKLLPKFYPSNYTCKDGSYLWLFDKEADVASRPYGVG